MKTVLVVEDIPSEQRLLANLLTEAGFEVAVAGTAEQAWAWLGSHPCPSLVLIDIVMPGQNGLDLCRQIRAKPEWERLPVVFCSQKDQEFDRFWALRQGGNGYLTKPFVPQQLLEAVRRHLS